MPVTTFTTRQYRDDSVTFAKTQNVSTDVVLSRYSAGTGDIETATRGFGVFFNSGSILSDFKHAGDVASASTTAVGTALGHIVNITGTVTITAFDTPPVSDAVRITRFASSLILTHSSTFVLQTGANITTQAGDHAIWYYDAANTRWVMTAYARANGQALVDGSGTPVIEPLSGTIDGSNVTFTISQTPLANTLDVRLNGQVLRSGAGNDYTISGTTITMAVAPISGDYLDARYSY